MWKAKAQINFDTPHIEDDSVFAVSIVCSVPLKSPLHSPAEMDEVGDGPETQKGALYSCRLLVRQVTSSHPLFPILCSTSCNNLTRSLD